MLLRPAPVLTLAALAACSAPTVNAPESWGEGAHAAMPPPEPPPSAEPTASAVTRASAQAAPADAKPSAPSKPRAAMLVEGTLEAPLFSDEVARVRKAIAKQLDANTVFPLVTLTDEHLAELTAVARAGKLRKDGPVCAAPPTRVDVVHAAHPDLVAVQWSLLCLGEQCNADVAVQDGPVRESGAFAERRVLEGSPSPDDATSVEAWERAIAAEALEAPAPMGGGGGVAMGIGGLESGDGAVHVMRVDAFHFSAAPKAADFAAEAKAAGTCAPRPAWGGRVLLAIGADGRAQRCESHAGKADCYCAAFSRHAFGKGEAGRRIRISFSHQASGGGAGKGGLGGLGAIGKAAPRTKVYVRQSGVTFDEAFELRRAREAALAACFSPGQKLEFDLDSKLDARGAVTRVTLAKGAAALSDAEKRCVETAARTFVYRCPDQEGDVVWGRFSVF